MKRRLCLLLALMLIVPCLALCEEADDASEPLTTEDILRLFEGGPPMDLSTAETLLGGITEESEEAARIRQDIQDLKACEGHFVQPSEAGKKVYTADISFYYYRGMPFCNLTYTNYAGELESGPVTRIGNAEEGYCFHAEPKGAFYRRNHVFSVDVGPENMRIRWKAEDDDWEGDYYQLDRGTGIASDEEDIPYV